MSQENQSKALIKTYQSGEMLFHDGDVADSLYIIQKGQIRLYKPKGKGFIEIGVLRAGEVIGEMAYFSEDEAGKRRSCSAAALTGLEVIEISFSAFGKTMQSMNPWFNTIINTLAARLRKANTRIRELEDNQTAHYGKAANHYEFLKSHDVIRILGTIFLVFRTHGEQVGMAYKLDKKIVDLYLTDIYQLTESKVASLIELLVKLDLIQKLPGDKFQLNNLEELRQIFIYYNTEKHLPDDKKLNVSEKCERFIQEMIKPEYQKCAEVAPVSKKDDETKKFSHHYVLNEILELLKDQKIDYSHLEDGRNIGLFGEVLEDKGRMFVETNFEKVKKMYPIIRFMNALKKEGQS